MTDERKLALFDNLVSWIYTHTENHGKKAYVTALKQVGYTPEEIKEELSTTNFDE